MLRLELEAQVANAQAEVEAMAADAAIESGTPLKSLEEMVEEADVADGLDPATAAELAPMAAVPAAAALTDDAGAAARRHDRRRTAGEPRRRRRRRGRGDAARLTPGRPVARSAGPHAAEPATLRPCPTACRSPGPSFLREHAVETNGRLLRAGMSRPTTTEDELVARDPVGRRRRRASSRSSTSRPPAGPRPEPPLALLGPSFAGALSGLILEDAGRLSIRLATVVPADDPTRPWRVPAAVRAAFRWEPMRAAAMRPNELAETVLAAFRRAIEGLGRP